MTRKDIIPAGTLLISLVIIVGTNLGLAWACLRVAQLGDPRVAGQTAPARRGGPDVVPGRDSTGVGTLGDVALDVGAGELSGVPPGLSAVTAWPVVRPRRPSPVSRLLGRPESPQRVVSCSGRWRIW